jgi:hypothetical protein
MKSEKFYRDGKSTIRRGWTSTCLFLWVGLFGLYGDAAAQEAEPFVERLDVREVSIVVNPSGALSRRDLKTITADELSVLEDGESRVVTRIESIQLETPPPDVEAYEGVERCPWTFVVYIDAVLAKPATAFENALAIGQRAESLVELGCVDLVVADPIPTTRVVKSRSAAFIAKALTDIAKTAGEARDRTSATSNWPRGTGDPSLTEVEDQWDRLLAFMAGRHTPGPKALFLISDGFTLPAADLELLAGRDSDQGTTPGQRRLADVIVDTAQTLSSYGWVTISLPEMLRGDPKPEAESSDFDRWRDVAEGRILPGEQRTMIYLFRSSRRGRSAGSFDARLYEAYLLPRLAPLRALAEATSGDVVWDPANLDRILQDLTQRRLLWFQTTEPHDGKIRRLRVQLAEGETQLDALWWKRSSTPQSVTESRLRRVLSGETLPQNLGMAAKIVSGKTNATDIESQHALRVQVDSMALDDQESAEGHVRISIGILHSADFVTFVHQTNYRTPHPSAPWEYTLPLQLPEDASQVIVGVENLIREEWGARVVDLPDR